MSSMLALSKLIDKISTWVGKFTMWLILATTLISAGNALVRKIFDTSSNSLLEIQWYLFAAVFLLAAGYTMLYAIAESVRRAQSTDTGAVIKALDDFRPRGVAGVTTLSNGQIVLILDMKELLSDLASLTDRDARNGHARALEFFG